MNKYQEALDWLSLSCDYEADYDSVKVLQELVEKVTPKKPIKRYYTTHYGNCGTKKRLDIRCPCCNSAFINGVRSSIGVFKSKEKEFIETVNNQKHCMFCSQAIDWSDEDVD